MKVKSLNEILTEDPPIQFMYLRKLLELFSQSKYLESAFIRGSLARNDYDRASDLDMVLAIEPSAYINLIDSIDELMMENFNVLFKGWPDRIVPAFGGIGFVYLIENGENILQIDLYILPSNKLNKLMNTPNVKMIYQNNQGINQEVSSHDNEINEYITNKFAHFPSIESLLVESAIIAYLIKKRIKRKEEFLNYSESILINKTLRDILRLIFDPSHKDYGWYHLKDTLFRHPTSTKWCLEFERILFHSTIHDSITIVKSLEFALHLTKEQCPEELVNIGTSFEHFIKKMKDGH
jgi:predicted nucleotidyltransferase